MLCRSFTFRRMMISISAGFPSPAEGFEDDSLNVHDYLVVNPAATFFIRFIGDGMEHEHVLNGSILVVDRSVRPRTGRLVVIRHDGEDELVRFTPGHRIYCRGVVVGIIHRF